MSDEAPKSAVELAMERLRQKDKEAGVSDHPLTEEQRARISEIRRVYEARLAEAEIFHRQKLAQVRDFDQQETVEEEYRRDRERLGSERDRKIEGARTSASSTR